MFLSNNMTSLNNPDDRPAGIPATNTTKPATQDTFLREYPLALKEATMISNSENDDVSVANKNKIKNNAKKRPPNAISPNTAGKTIKSRPGPSAGSKPNANTTGKITRPAKIETMMFINTTVLADFGMLTVLSK